MVKDFVKSFLPTPVLDFYHLFLAAAGAFLYGFPSRKLIVTGVTGTNGKSTVVEMCHQILREAGFKTASISSVRFKINDEEWPNKLKMTMPGRFQMQKFLKQALKAGCRHVVLEVTSEGIKQHRHRFINFQTAILTNLTPEHIESHGGFEKYREAKAQLFKTAKKFHIINLGDDNAEYFLQFSADEKYGYGIKLKSKNEKLKTTIKNLKPVEAQNCSVSLQGLKFSIGDTEFTLNLLGEFNISNALAAICVGVSQGVQPDVFKKALERMRGVPGRMEVVIREPFTVIVDYAHTPDALQKVYTTIQDSRLKIQESRMICVFGSAGGGRDKWKRPEMGKIAAQYCNEIILTNEDPYDENPEKILDEIELGIQNTKYKIPDTKKILDRREAIRAALGAARPGDTVIITGKGCEPWICVAKGKKIPWDDRRVIREELAVRKI